MTTRRWHGLIEQACHRPGVSLLLFSTALILLGVLGLGRANPQIINSDLFSLVNDKLGSELQQTALNRIRTLSEQRQTWMIAHPNQDTAYLAASRLKQRLLGSDLFTSAGNSAGLNDILTVYGRYPYRLADDASLVLARSAAAAGLIERVERTLFTGAMTLPLISLSRDPFLFEAHFLQALSRTPAPFSIDRGLLTAYIDETWTYLVPIILRGNAFDFKYQRQVQAFTDEVQEELGGQPGLLVFSVGAVDFATANRELALNEVGLIGSASMLLIALLLLGTFRHARPFLAVGFTIVSGVAGGAAICLVSFQSIHLLTLVGGSSLIGISVDYAFHLLTDGYRKEGENWSVAVGLKTVLPTVSLGLLTSLVGFTGLYASGFQGLQEIAVFSSAGLITSYLGLIAGYPLLLARWQPTHNNPLGLRIAAFWSRHWRPDRRVILTLALGVGALALFTPPLTANSDIRLLSAHSAQIDALLERATKLTASLLDSRFILIEAPAVDSLLQREEKLREVLITQRDQGSIAHFNQLSQFVPSPARQAQVLELNQALYLEPGSALEALTERIGLNKDVVRELQDAVRAASASTGFLELDDWLQSPLAPLAAHLYLGRAGQGVASVVTLGGVTDVDSVAASVSGLEGVRFVDNVAAISAVFEQYVENAVRGLAIAFLLVSLLMVLRFGLLEGALTMLVPLIAFAVTLGVLQLVGESINLFHIVGLTLILGTGMDYTLFLKSTDAKSHTMLAVMLAALTTECAFGLLGLSQVGAIHSFGFAVALGTAVTFLLAPMVSGVSAHRSAAAS